MEYRRINSIAESCNSYPYLDNRHHPRGLTSAQYKLILKLFLKKLANELVRTGAAIDLLKIIGTFKVMSWKRNIRRKIVNFASTNKARLEGNDPNIIKYDLNFNSTEGYQPVLRWIKNGARATKVRETSITGKYNRATFAHRRNYSAVFTRTVMRRNLNHNIHADVNLMTYFKNEGYFKYDKLN